LDDDRDSKILKSDLTAGEFYRGMKDTFSLWALKILLFIDFRCK
jgi:hypothetical protein